MSTIISNVTTFVTGAVGWMGQFLGEITSDTSGVLMTFVVALPLVGLGVGLLKRLISVRG